MHHASPWFLLTLCVLATWRLSHLVASEDGPFDLIVRLRARAGDGMLGKLMDCPYCLSLWIAAPAALLLTTWFPEWCVAWLAISGGSSLLEKIARRADRPEGGEDALLRTETRSDEHQPECPGSGGAAASTPLGPRA